MKGGCKPKRTDAGNASLPVLDHLLAVSRHLESENVPATRMPMSCGHVETAAGEVPVIVQTPFSSLV